MEQIKIETTNRLILALRYFIREQGSNKQAAKELGIAESKLSKLLKQNCKIDFDFLTTFFHTSKTSPDWVFFGRGEMLS